VTRSPGQEIQQAIAFLHACEPADRHGILLPARPDYEALARRAAEHGLALSPGAIQEAFRMIMCARLVAARRIAPPDAGG
jgi:hypothetical protein